MIPLEFKHVLFMQCHLVLVKFLLPHFYLIQCNSSLLGSYDKYFSKRI